LPLKVTKTSKFSELCSFYGAICIVFSSKKQDFVAVFGIAPDKLPHIFEKFYRVPIGNVYDIKGYGLGLFYVKTMVEKHGWRVQEESQSGEGALFPITL